MTTSQTKIKTESVITAAGTADPELVRADILWIRTATGSAIIMRHAGPAVEQAEAEEADRAAEDFKPDLNYELTNDHLQI